jgi:hypothetical protein
MSCFVYLSKASIDSVALLNQIRSIDKQRLIKRLGTLAGCFANAFSYSDFQMNRPHADLSPNLSPRRREALIISPSLLGKGLGVRSHDCSDTTENCCNYADERSN